MAKKPAKKTTKPKGPTRGDLIAEALDYRRQGAGAEEIAGTLTANHKKKFTPREAANLVSEGLQQIIRSSTKENTLLDIERCNAIMLSKYEAATSGDSDAIDIVARFMASRSRLEERLAALNEDFFIAINKTRMGRPPHQPTDETIAMVQAMAHEGIETERIAKYIGIDENTLNKHYGEAMKDIRAKRKSIASGILWRGVLERNAAHLFFYLKTQCGYRETDRFPDKGGGGGDGPETGETITIKGGLPEPEPLTADPQVAS